MNNSLRAPETYAKLVTGVIPCAGFGSRVRHLLETGQSKETVISPCGFAVIHQHLDFMISCDKIHNIVIPINYTKTSTILSVFDWAMIKCSDSGDTLRYNKALKYSNMDLHTRVSPKGRENPALIRFNDAIEVDGRSINIHFVIIPEVHITDNPESSIRIAVEVVENALGNSAIVHGENIDMLISFPDVWYTNPESVIEQLRKPSFTSRNPKVCAINPNVYQSIDMDLAGRVSMTQCRTKVERLVHVRDKLFVCSDNTFAEVGLMYGSSSALIDQTLGEWVYDRMQSSGSLAVEPILIESDIINYGDPRSFEDGSDIDTIEDVDESLEDDLELIED